MFKRKLQALEYPNYESFKIDDESEYRALVVWLEDQRIRHYKIEERASLRNVDADDWQKALKEYLECLDSNVDYAKAKEVIDWLLGCAVRLEYGDDVDKFCNASATSGASDSTASPFDSMDFESPDFKAGVASLAAMLQIPPHDDHEVVCKAVCILMTDKFNQRAMQVAKSAECCRETVALQDIPLGFEAGDTVSTDLAKILRLLHIKDLRSLQNQINGAIVQVQALVANPKTDNALGKVGR